MRQRRKVCRKRGAWTHLSSFPASPRGEKCAGKGAHGTERGRAIREQGQKKRAERRAEKRRIHFHAHGKKRMAGGCMPENGHGSERIWPEPFMADQSHEGGGVGGLCGCVRDFSCGRRSERRRGCRMRRRPGRPARRAARRRTGAFRGRGTDMSRTDSR